MNRCRTARALLLLAVFTAAVAPRAEAIPAFARKYGVSCTMCHTTAPALNEFGETFAGNGFEFVVGEPARDTIPTGDELLRLLDRINIAFRFDSYVRARTARSGNGPSVDMQTPFGVKLLSGGPIANRISYYMYFFMSERGEVAGLEDAYIQFTDLGGSGVNLMVGQFQSSDPLFKRELRLEFEDYQAYRVRVGEVRTDLTYDRGLMGTYSPWSDGDLTVLLVNGQGLDEADERLNYDRDSGKSVGVRFSQGLGPIRVGGFAYYGNSSEPESGVDNDLIIFGPDASVPVGANAEVNLQYLRRLDSNPFFLGADPAETTVDAGFAEVLWWPQGRMGRWALTGLYNHVSADQPVVSLRLGEQVDEPGGYLRRYRSATVGANYLLRRNVRFLAETGWDFEGDFARFTTGFMAAF